MVSVPLITALQRFLLPLFKPRLSAIRIGGREELSLYKTSPYLRQGHRELSYTYLAE